MGGTPNKAEEEEEGEERSFEDLGLDPRLVRALAKKKTGDQPEGICKPTPIQLVAIPLILEGKDVVARANTGSGKTLAYLLPMLHKLFAESGSRKTGPSAFILVPSRELCQQVHSEASSLLEHCRVQVKVVQLTNKMSVVDMRKSLAGPPDVVVSTPACISTCISKGALQAKTIQDSLSMLVLDEADVFLMQGHENDLKALIPHVPLRCQCLLMSATSRTEDVEKLKRLVLHNPVTLTLSEVGHVKDDIVPKSVQQFWIPSAARDKLLHILALLQLDLVQKKVLIFVNSIDMGYKLKLFLEQFGFRSGVLNAELPQNSRLHILEEFNAGLFDYLIAIDDGEMKGKEQTVGENHTQSRKSKKHLRQKLDSEFGVVRGIDFKNVHTVINHDMPPNSIAYVHRIGRTGRAHNTGESISLVSPEEAGVFEDIKCMLGDEDQNTTKLISPYPFLKKSAVEALRYRAEDVDKGVTKFAIREARAQDLRKEILNSDKLKDHFDNNPREYEMLNHDKLLSKKPPPPHLRKVPEYLLDQTTRMTSKIVKLSRAVMGNGSSTRRSRFRSGSGKSRDPLKTFSAEGKKSRRGQVKRKDGGGEAENPKRRKKVKQ